MNRTRDELVEALCKAAKEWHSEWLVKMQHDGPFPHPIVERLAAVLDSTDNLVLTDKEPTNAE